MNLKNFQILVLRNGHQIIQGLVSPKEYSRLGSIISTFPNESELKWFKSEILKARKKEKRTYTGQNIFVCFVSDDNCEIGHEEHRSDLRGYQTIPTDIVIEYINECIEFYQDYESGKISGIIPESKKDEWIIVPKEYVKDIYWEKYPEKKV